MLLNRTVRSKHQFCTDTNMVATSVDTIEGGGGAAPKARSIVQLLAFAFLILSIEILLGRYMFNQMKANFKSEFLAKIQSETCKDEIREIFLSEGIVNKFKESLNNEEVEKLSLKFAERCFDGDSDCRGYERARRDTREVLFDDGHVHGQKGDRGELGIMGGPGKPGMPGMPGFPGLNGMPGMRGEIGARGEPGNGVEGPPGAKGEPGDVDWQRF